MARFRGVDADPEGRTNAVAARRRSPLTIWINQKGNSATEFALVAPILILLLLGMSDVIPTTTAEFKVNHTTEAVADLVAQYSQMQTTDMVSAFTAAGDMLTPYSSLPLSIRITNVYSDGIGHAWVYWSCGEGTLPAYAAKTPVTTTPNGDPVSNLIWLYSGVSGGFTENGANTSYVMTESAYTYTAPARFVIPNPVPIASTAYVLPRQTGYVGFPWSGVASSPATVPTSTLLTRSVTLSNGAICNYAT